MSGNAAAKTVELHRPYIDEITCTCPECGGKMEALGDDLEKMNWIMKWLL